MQTEKHRQTHCGRSHMEDNMIQKYSLTGKPKERRRHYERNTESQVGTRAVKALLTGYSIGLGQSWFIFAVE